MSRTLAAVEPAALRPRLRGVLAFPITPFDDDGALDVRAVGANAAWLAASGIHALVAPSGTGELFGLSPAECSAVVAAIAEATSLGVVIYARDGALIGTEQLERLARDVPNLIGFKDGRGDIRL